MDRPYSNRVRAILQSTGLEKIVPVPISKIAEAWGFQVFLTNLTSHQVTGGLFDLYDNQQNIYLEKTNSSIENEFILAYFLSLWDVVDNTHDSSASLITAGYEHLGKIDKSEMFLDVLEGNRLEALRMAVTLLVPPHELERLAKSGQSLNLSFLTLKFGVPLSVAGVAWEQDEIYLSQNFQHDYNP
jgi:hypothetical protein